MKKRKETKGERRREMGDENAGSRQKRKESTRDERVEEEMDREGAGSKAIVVPKTEDTEGTQDHNGNHNRHRRTGDNIAMEEEQTTRRDFHSEWKARHQKALIYYLGKMLLIMSSIYLFKTKTIAGQRQSLNRQCLLQPRLCRAIRYGRVRHARKYAYGSLV
jgi:hypothetical protein